MVFNRKQERQVPASLQERFPQPPAAAMETMPDRYAGPALSDRSDARLAAARTAIPSPSPVPAPSIVVPAWQSDTPESIIGNDLAIEGQSITIRCQGTLRVNGTIQADLHSRQLIVGDAARIDGAITAETVSVSGEVHGSIHGSRVLLLNGSMVEGDIHAERLVIEEGASFDGRSRRVSDPREVAPQVEPSLRRESGPVRPAAGTAAAGPAPLNQAFFPAAATKVGG